MRDSIIILPFLPLFILRVDGCKDSSNYVLIKGVAKMHGIH